MKNKLDEVCKLIILPFTILKSIKMLKALSCFFFFNNFISYHILFHNIFLNYIKKIYIFSCILDQNRVFISRLPTALQLVAMFSID